jgi:hypothetical protein
VESFVGVVTAVISVMTGAVVVVVTVVVAVEDSSSTSVQELTVNIKIMERIMRIYLKELPVSGLGIH